MKNKFVKFCVYSIWVLFFVAIIVMVIDSIFRSTYFTTGQEIEIPSYTWDNPVYVLLGVCIFIAVAALLAYKNKLLCKVLLPKLLLCMFTIGIFFICLLRAYPTCDGGALSEIALEFMDGNYSALKQPNYLYIYPFQLGMTGLIQLVYSIFGRNNYIVLQIINLLGALGISYALYRSTQLLFEDDRINRFFVLLMIGMFPLHLYISFVYGNILGLCFSSLAIMHEILFMKTEKWKYMIYSGIMIGLGILFKSNSTVFLIAMEIVLLLYCILKKRLKVILACIVILVLSQLPMSAVNRYYLQKADIEQMPEGVPGVAWIAMGLQEDDIFENGWYNGYNLNTYTESGFDAEKTAELSMESIKESLSVFVKHPAYTVRFFYRKWSSQWNDPTYQSLFSMEWSCRRNEEQSQLARSVYEGTVSKLLYWFMNIYQTVCFLSVAVFCVKRRKQMELCQMLVMLSVFGGMLCHLLWEAKGRYVFSYYVLLLPFAAFGVKELVTDVGKVYRMCCERVKEKRKSVEQ
ncbi:MAG: glycosyltransferase family 39 protein [Lachnospiraceae bacterium]